MAKPVDPQRQKEASEWIESLTGSPVTNFHESLKSGVILCK